MSAPIPAKSIPASAGLKLLKNSAPPLAVSKPLDKSLAVSLSSSDNLPNGVDKAANGAAAVPVNPAVLPNILNLLGDKDSIGPAFPSRASNNASTAFLSITPLLI